MYHISTGHQIRTMPVKIESIEIGRNVAIHDQGCAVLSAAIMIAYMYLIKYVFNQRTGDVRDVISAGTDWVQTVIVSTLDSMKSNQLIIIEHGY